MQCKKTSDTTKEEVLPAETQTGADTFGCLVNGKVWLPKGKFPYSGLTATIQFNGFQINASQGKQYIHIAKNDFKQIGEFPLNSFDKDAAFIDKEDEYKCTDGVLTITKYDKSNQIVSGRFWFNAKNNAGDILAITAGRFDLRYTN